MTDPVRLREGVGSVTQRVLRSADADGLRKGQTAQVMGALGLAGPAAAITMGATTASPAVTAPSTTASTAGLAGSGTAGGSAAASLGAAKAVGFGLLTKVLVAVVGGGGVMTALWLDLAAVGDDSARVVANPPPSASLRAQAERTAPPMAEPVVVPEPEPARAPERGTNKATPAARGNPSLLEDVRAIDGIRAALANGNANQALSRLDAFEQGASGARFAGEARVLRIEALAQAGQLSQAKALATDYLKAQPKSPYAARLGGVLAR